MAVPPNVTVLDHPLVHHKLTLLRRKETSTGEFRRLMRELSLLMAYEVTRNLPTETVTIETPLESTEQPLLSGKKLCFLSILRAGNGMLDGMLDLVPSARVAHIGLYRDPHTLAAVEYYLKLPDDIRDRLVIVIDPMLATGHSAIAALHRV
jgi:uracil phosphoribosyltransferase